MPIGAIIARVSTALAAASAQTLARLGKLLNVPGTQAAILKAIKDNPLTAILIAVELFDASDPDIQRVAASNSDAAQIVATAARRIVQPDYTPDEVTDADVARFRELQSRLQDEMMLLDQASAIVGGIERLNIVLNAARVSTNVRKMHALERGHGHLDI